MASTTTLVGIKPLDVATPFNRSPSSTRSSTFVRKRTSPPNSSILRRIAFTATGQKICAHQPAGPGSDDDGAMLQRRVARRRHRERGFVELLDLNIRRGLKRAFGFNFKVVSEPELPFVAEIEGLAENAEVADF